jgi:hypothetical protein
MLIDEIASYSQVATSALAVTAGTWTMVRRRRRPEPGVRPGTVLIVVHHDDDARVLLDALRSAQPGGDGCA